MLLFYSELLTLSQHKNIFETFHCLGKIISFLDIMNRSIDLENNVVVIIHIQHAVCLHFQTLCKSGCFEFFGFLFHNFFLVLQAFEEDNLKSEKGDNWGCALDYFHFYRNSPEFSLSGKILHAPTHQVL